MKTNESLSERMLDIYLQIAERARLSGDHHLTDSMLLAAHEQIVKTAGCITDRTLTRLAELLTLQNHLAKAEEIFEQALKCAGKGSTNIWLQARIHDGLAEVYIRLSDLQKARKKCQQAIRMISKISNCDSTLLASRKRKLALINMLLTGDIRSDEVVAYLRIRPS